MRRRKTKVLPLPPELAKFVEADTELPKGALISRIAGTVSYGMLQFIKSLQFHSIRKDGQGQISLL